MYKQTCAVKIEGIPKGEPIDLYIMKRGADLLAAAVTSNTYQATRIEVESGIREVEDFTRMCSEHEFNLVRDRNNPMQYNLEFILDMMDELCSVDEYPCQRAELPEQLVNCLSG